MLKFQYLLGSLCLATMSFWNAYPTVPAIMVWSVWRSSGVQDLHLPPPSWSRWAR